MNKFSNAYLKAVFGLPKNGAVLVGLYIDTGTLLMKNRLLKAQALFCHHLSTLPPDSLANEFYCAQKSHKYPSVVTLCEEFFEKHNLLNIENYSKREFKKIINKIIFEQNREDIISWARTYKKVDIGKCTNERFGMKSYLKTMNVSMARMHHRISYFQIPSFRMDYKNKKQYREEKWLCPQCVIKIPRTPPPPGFPPLPPWWWRGPVWAGRRAWWPWPCPLHLPGKHNSSNFYGLQRPKARSPIFSKDCRKEKTTRNSIEEQGRRSADSLLID